MDRSRRVDIDGVSGRQNRIAGRGEILSQSWRKSEKIDYNSLASRVRIGTLSILKYT